MKQITSLETLTTSKAFRVLKVPAGAAILLFVLAVSAFAQSNATLPVYEVTSAGLSSAQSTRLASALHLPAERFTLADGVAMSVDTNNYLHVPATALNDAVLVNQLRLSGGNDHPGIQLRPEVIDFDALGKLNVFDEDTALKTTAAAFDAAGLRLELAKPVAGHTKLTITTIDANGAKKSVTHLLDTRVNYPLFDKNGHPFIGSGAQIQVTYDANGKVIQLHYANRELKEGPSVKILSEDEARKRVAGRFPSNARISLQLVYWTPSLRRAPGHQAPVSPKYIIPWYAISSVIPVTNPRTGAASELHSKVQLIPATDDPRFVPTVSVRATGGRQVTASAVVTGGQAPYTYVWTGSNPETVDYAGGSIRYLPLTRVASLPAQAETVHGNETVTLTVIDANGVSVQASQIVAVDAQPVQAIKGKGPSASYGTESPREPDFAIDRVGWQEGMASPGGGTQRFAWLGDTAWPGDFIEPVPAGTLPSTPWINGDADYANWGVNTAAIVLNNTDGWAEGFASSQPGATIAQYATAELLYPANQSGTVVTNLLDWNTTATTKYSKISYNNSWGPFGPNDQLLWLAMDACDTLDATDSAGNAQTRWGPAFGGLHILTGWNSEEQVADGSFERDFAENFLGVSGSAQTIVQAWFNSAQTAGPGHGVPAALGPITTGNVSDVNDFYLGKGTQGPSIKHANIIGWWYLTN